LSVKTVILRGRSRPGIEMIIAPAAPPDQHRRDRVALQRAAAVRVRVRHGAVEAEMPLRVSWLQIIQPVQPRFRAHFQIVAAENLRDAGGEAVDVVSAPDEPVADLSDLLVTFR